MEPMDTTPPSLGGRGVARARGRSTTLQRRPGAEPPRPSSSMSMASSVSMPVGPGGDMRGISGPSRSEMQRPSRPVSAASVASSSALVRTRPDFLTNKCGSSGRTIKLTANYFQLTSVTDWTVNQYHVDFNNEEDRPAVRKNLIKAHTHLIGPYLFDGMILFTTSNLKSPTEFTSMDVNNKPVKITLTRTRELKSGDHEYLQFFNIMMRKCLGQLKLQQVGRNYFDPHAKVIIPDYNMELWPGYVTSIRQHENLILMCAEVTHKVMRTDTVLSFLQQMSRNYRDSNELKQAFKNAVLGLVVLTDFNNKTYRVDDVNFEVDPRSTFFHSKENRQVSYAEYYKMRHNITIRNMDQPLLLTKSKPKEIRAGQSESIFLIPELCRMTGLTDDMRANTRLMRALADHTRVGPDSRVEKLLNFSKRLREQPEVNEELTKWNMGFDKGLVTFEGRVLEEETIVQGRSGHEIKYKAGNSANWTTAVSRNEMLTYRELDDWGVVVPRNLKTITSDFVGHVQDTAKKMGMKISDPIVQFVDDDKAPTYVNAIQHLLSTQEIKFLMCAVPSDRSDRYSAIKKVCCVDRAVPSQVVTKRAMSVKGIRSVAGKVAVQMNCKMGGCPWTVEVPMQNVMVVGFDASHDTMNKGLSFGALVASLDNTFSRYFSCVSPHKSGEELSNDVSIHLVKALDKYLELRGCLPTRIIIYRDGVGDGQIPFVYKHEVEQIKEKLTEKYKGQKLQMAFIIVSKRLNSRIFSVTSRAVSNPPPGTIVDNCITLPERYDFFVVSQSVNQGSVSPTSYNVIYDNTGLAPDHMQRLTYKMTHLYFNWSGTVRVPAPVQYAHKLAQLVGQYLHRLPCNGMEDTLYYL